MKKFISLFLSIVMLLSITIGLDLSAHAQTSGDFEYTILSNGTAEITRYSGSATEITIPSELDGYIVTSIGNLAFFSSNIHSVRIGKNVRNIHENAFHTCHYITNFEVDETNQNFSSYNGVLFNRKRTILIKYPNRKEGTSYSIPNGVTEIRGMAFESCGLKNITIPDSVTLIGNYAFAYCQKLADVNIPNSVTSIGSYAFCFCHSITDITIPNSVISMGSGAFSECYGLISVELSNSLKAIEYGTFWNCEKLLGITIPKSVSKIDSGAFYGCQSLESLYIMNKSCYIYEDSITIDNESAIIYGYEGSTAQKHAEKYGFIFSVIECSNHIWGNGTVTKAATCIATGVKTFTCTNCGETKIETIAKTAHKVVTDAAVTATCTKTGKTAGSHCSVCGQVITAQKTVANKAHTYKTTTTKATTKKNGSKVTKCTVCGNVKSKSTIYYPKTITLSATSYTYDGKVKKPSVKVVGSNDKTISSSSYTVTYASGRKNVGKYTVTIKFKGNYSGTVKKTFTIKPKSTTLSSITAKSKGFTVKWKKQTTQTTGYQIQYSTSSSFSSAKTVTVSKNSTTSKTVSKLTGKKKYYVRIRTYKTVKVNGKNTKIYSAWSKVKTVTTKK